ncbi:MAG: ribbon-helix-helix protein, CopG family [Candidatus Bathyarchaeia archaeon]
MSKKVKQPKVTSFVLEKLDKKLLTARSQKLGISRSDVIRMLIREHLTPEGA